jgi:uncharacterized membrane protein YfcA
MSPLAFELSVFAVSIFAGAVGSLLGLGGGIIVVPALTLLFDVPIQYAIGASIVAVIATSSGAASAYVRDGLANLRTAMVLEVATTAGALTGAFLTGRISARWLFVIFGLVLAYSSIVMYRKRHELDDDESVDRRAPWADFLRLHSSYYDQRLGREIVYRVVRTRVGLAWMYLAGAISGLLGIGSGSLKVTAMDIAMQMPIKVSSATSNFMIGVTAAASAGVYFMRGDIDPFIAAPVAVGVLVGALIGSHLLPKLRSSTIRLFFVFILLIISAQMLYKGVRYERLESRPVDPVSQS